MDDIMKVMGGCVLVIALVVGVAVLMAFPTMWVWNWLMPGLFGIKTITFSQALGINFLSSILFKPVNTGKKD